MTHPEDLLSDYVDGTLGDPQRAVVHAHLQECARCREDVELATGAAHALATLEEVPVPFGVTDPVLAEARGRFERRRTIASGRVQWAAGLAAAAALVLVVVLNVGDTGSQPAFDVATGGTGTAAGGAEAAPEAQRLAAGFEGLERQRGVNYDEDGIRAVARDTATALKDGAEEAGAAALAPDSAGATLTFASPGRALSCLRRGGAPLGEDTLIRLIEAEFEGRPAYIATFLERPGAGQPANEVLVWVADRDGCRFLSGATQPI